MKDYYAILGVPENASGDAIKKAFRKLALKFHPDKNPDNQKWAEEKFKEINEAFSVLGEPDRRREYDLRRKSPFAAAGDYSYSQQDIFRSSFSNPNFYEQMNRIFRDMGLRFDQDFVNRSFFNGQTFFYGSPNQGAGNTSTQQRFAAGRKPSLLARWFSRCFNWIIKRTLRAAFGIDLAGVDPDIHRNMRVSPKEAETGCSKMIYYKRNGEKKALEVKIPPGVKTGTKIRLSGMGSQGYRKGDLYLHVKVKTFFALF